MWLVLVQGHTCEILQVLLRFVCGPSDCSLSAVSLRVCLIWWGLLRRNRCCVLVPLFYPPLRNVTMLDRVVRAHYCGVQPEVFVWLLPQNIFFRCVKENVGNVLQLDLPQEWKTPAGLHFLRFVLLVFHFHIIEVNGSQMPFVIDFTMFIIIYIYLYSFYSYFECFI